MSGPSQIDRAFVEQLAQLGRERIADKGEVYEGHIDEDAATLELIMNGAAGWPAFADTPRAFQDTLWRLIEQRRAVIRRDGELSREAICKIFDLIRATPDSIPELTEMVVEYRVAIFIVVMAFAAVLLTARDVASRGGADPDVVMEAAAAQLSGLEYRFVLKHLPFVSQALARSYP